MADRSPDRGTSETAEPSALARLPQRPGRATPSSGPTRRQSERLADAASERAIAIGSLRTALGAFVHALRARGAPPERMLVEIKRLLDANALTSWVGRSPGEGNELYGQLVSWSIRQYFRR